MDYKANLIAFSERLAAIGWKHKILHPDRVVQIQTVYGLNEEQRILFAELLSQVTKQGVVPAECPEGMISFQAIDAADVLLHDIIDTRV